MRRPIIYPSGKMKKTIIMLFLSTVFVTYAKDVKSIENNKNEFQEAKAGSSIELSKNDKLILRKDKAILILKVNKSSNVSSGNNLTESGEFSWMLVTENKVKANSIKSTILYKITIKKDNSRNLKRQSGDQVLNIVPFRLTWSYSSEESVWLYLPEKVKYIKIKG